MRPCSLVSLQHRLTGAAAQTAEPSLSLGDYSLTGRWSRLPFGMRGMPRTYSSLAFGAGGRPPSRVALRATHSWQAIASGRRGDPWRIFDALCGGSTDQARNSFSRGKRKRSKAACRENSPSIDPGSIRRHSRRRIWLAHPTGFEPV